MAKKHLVTTSLVGAVEWAQTAPTSVIKPEKGGDGKMTWARKAVIDLKNTLNREPYEMNVAAQRGVNFEKKVYEAARTGDIGSGSDHFREVVEICIGGTFQRKCKMEYQIEDYLCFLYGKEDVYFPGKIWDLKTTAKFKRESYVNSFQHVLYAFVEQTPDFEYVVAEWDEYPKIKAVHRVPLKVDLAMAKIIVDKTILSTFGFLKAHGLWEDYRERFCLY